MYGYISANLVSLIYLIILSSVYFLKRKYNFIESKVYKALLISTMVTLLLDIISVYMCGNGLWNINIFAKLYFIVLFIWLFMFIFYIILNNTKLKYDNIKSMLKDSIICQCYLAFSIITFILLLFSNINYNLDSASYYGNGVSLVYMLGVISCLFLLILILINSKNNHSYKNWVILASIIVLCMSFFIEMKYDHIFVLGSGISIITIILYFTIENPDIKYIEELNALKEAAEEANREKTNFLASMSHEIRTPMNAIIGLSQSVLTNDLPKTVKEDIKNINKAGDTLLEIVNNILDITKIEEGKTKINNRPYNLGDVIAELTNIVNISLPNSTITFKNDDVCYIGPKYKNCFMEVINYDTVSK